MNIIMLNISWQHTAIIIAIILAVTIIIVAYMLLKLNREPRSNVYFDRLYEANSQKGTLLYKFENEARRKTPIKCTVFIAGSTRLSEEHNVIKASIADLNIDQNFYNRGVHVEARNLSLGHEQSEYNKIIVAPDTRFFILILDSKIDGTIVTEQEFDLALLVKDRLDIIIFDRKYDKPNDNEIVARIKEKHQKAYNGDRYLIKYSGIEHLGSECYKILSRKICKLYNV